jgi:hypothetical protein
MSPNEAVVAIIQRNQRGSLRNQLVQRSWKSRPVSGEPGFEEKYIGLKLHSLALHAWAEEALMQERQVSSLKMLPNSVDRKESIEKGSCLLLWRTNWVFAWIRDSRGRSEPGKNSWARWNLAVKLNAFWSQSHRHSLHYKLRPSAFALWFPSAGSYFRTTRYMQSLPLS